MITYKTFGATLFLLNHFNKKTPALNCKWIEKHAITMYPSSHSFDDLAQSLLPQMPDKVWYNAMMVGA